MRKGIVVGFFLAVAAMMAALPAHNLHRYLVKGEAIQSGNWWDVANLYNADDVIERVSLALYRFGISTSPSQVIVGKEGWLFLGDDFRQTISVHRDGPPSDFRQQSEGIVDAQAAWDAWLKERGIEAFHTILGPNKSSIHPEFLPDWAVSDKEPLSSVIMSVEGAEEHIYDPTEYLKDLSADLGMPLYYYNDTHWTPVAAQFAGQKFLERVQDEMPELKIPTFTDELILSDSNRGDLAGLLRARDTLTTKEHIPELADPATVEITSVIYETGDWVSAGGNPFFDLLDRPFLVKSPNALNAKKLLWLRDSYGTSMSPYIAAAFSETLHVYWIPALEGNSRLFVELVEAWEPDIVLMTIVERDTPAGLLTNMPPD